MIERDRPNHPFYRLLNMGHDRCSFRLVDSSAYALVGESKAHAKPEAVGFLETWMDAHEFLTKVREKCRALRRSSSLSVASTWPPAASIQGASSPPRPTNSMGRAAQEALSSARSARTRRGRTRRRPRGPAMPGLVAQYVLFARN